MPLVLFHRFDPEVVLQQIEHWLTTATIGSITAFTALMNHPSLGEHDISHVTKVYSGGQAIAPALVEAFEAQVDTDSYRGETVKAFVSLKRGQKVEEEPIAFCGERMAAYKRPRSVVILDELPKTASGRFLRRELRDFPSAH